MLSQRIIATSASPRGQSQEGGEVSTTWSWVLRSQPAGAWSSSI